MIEQDILVYLKKISKQLEDIAKNQNKIMKEIDSMNREIENFQSTATLVIDDILPEEGTLLN